MYLPPSPGQDIAPGRWSPGQEDGAGSRGEHAAVLHRVSREVDLIHRKHVT